MGRIETVLVVSDIHYASDAEKERGMTEFQVIRNPALRLLVRIYRHCIWRRDPFAHNDLLDRFIAAGAGADWVVANGDYSCDTAFVGLSDSPSFESARICLQKLRAGFGVKVAFTVGDHELGKTSLFGARGGLRFASWQRLRDLELEPFWRRETGPYLLLGI